MKTVLKDRYSISNLIRSKLGLLRDKSQTDIDEIDLWLNATISQTQEGSPLLKDRCEICDSKEDRKNLELHHIAGRKHDFRTVTACKKCHSHLSKEQGLRDNRWFQQASVELQDAFLLQGLRDMLILKSLCTNNSHYRELAESLVNETAQLLRGD